MNVHIQSVGSTIYPTKITDSSGADIRGVVDAKIHLQANAPNTVVLEILTTSVNVKAEASFMAMNPRTGRLAKVASMTFADGEVWEAE